MKLSKTYNLRVVNPGLAAQWHPVKNNDLKPEDVTPGSDKKVWWVCEKSHEWQALVAYRTIGSGCPYCSGRRVNKDNCLKTKNPSLARQWHPVKNVNLTPVDVTSNSAKKVWWICEKGHEWKAVVANRNTGGYGCPYCSRHRVNKDNCLKTKNPSLARQWHPFKNGNLTPEDVTPGSQKKVWWICEKGHEWKVNISSRNSMKTGCPYCSKKSSEYELTITNPVLSEMWHPEKNGNLIPADVTANSTNNVWWLCKKGHEWQEKVYLQDRSYGCPLCHKENANKKFKNRFRRTIFRGFYKPRVLGNGSKSSPIRVTTTIEEKITKQVKGKIEEYRKIVPYARYVYGLDRIPEGWVIWHIDGDPLNNNIENLECISRSELMRRMREKKFIKNP